LKDPEIYSKAHRVVVWLGKEAVDSKGLLEDLRLAANDKSTEHPKKEIHQHAILNLLQRHGSSASGQGNVMMFGTNEKH
jgi:hypothetical protein